LWCLDKFIFAPKRRERQAAAQAATGDSLDKKTLKKSARNRAGWKRRIGISGAGDCSGGAFIYL
jgi:hypothetical protein